MKTHEIISAVDNGKRVFWKSEAYQVVKDIKGQYLIKCATNAHCIGLTWADGETLNGKEEDFYIHPSEINYANADEKLHCEIAEVINAAVCQVLASNGLNPDLSENNDEVAHTRQTLTDCLWDLVRDSRKPAPVYVSGKVTLLTPKDEDYKQAVETYDGFTPRTDDDARIVAYFRFEDEEQPLYFAQVKSGKFMLILDNMDWLTSDIVEIIRQCVDYNNFEAAN